MAMDKDLARKLGGPMTLGDHAEVWARLQNLPVPKRGTPEWAELFRRWHDSAFADLLKAPSSTDSDH